MSVVKSQRTDKSDMCYLANEIEYKIIRMTMNEKYFPKRARFIISNKLIDAAMNVSANFNAANAIFPNTEDKLTLREQYQMIGKANIAILEHQLNLSKRLFNIPTPVLDDVFNQISEMKKMFNNWVKSGRKILKREIEKQNKKENKQKGKIFTGYILHRLTAATAVTFVMSTTTAMRTTTMRVTLMAAPLDYGLFGL